MTKKYLLLIISLLILLLSGILYFQKINKTNTITTRNYSTLQNYPHHSINEIKQKNLTSGNYNTEGYVIKQYVCPACPKGYMCKPCMGNHIVISENNKTIETYLLTDSEIILFVNNPKQFELGKKYSFSIKLLNTKTTNEPINDIKLIGYSSQYFFDKEKFCPDKGNCQDFGLESRKCNNLGACIASCNYGCVSKTWLEGRGDCEAIWPNFNCECRDNLCQRK